MVTSRSRSRRTSKSVQASASAQQSPCERFWSKYGISAWFLIMVIATIMIMMWDQKTYAAERDRASHFLRRHETFHTQAVVTTIVSMHEIHLRLAGQSGDPFAFQFNSVEESTKPCVLRAIPWQEYSGMFGCRYIQNDTQDVQVCAHPSIYGTSGAGVRSWIYQWPSFSINSTVNVFVNIAELANPVTLCHPYPIHWSVERGFHAVFWVAVCFVAITAGFCMLPGCCEFAPPQTPKVEEDYYRAADAPTMR